MEVLAIVGGVAAAITLSGELVRLSRSLREIFRSVKYARREIRKTADEMIIFAELFEGFLDCCSDGTPSDTRSSFSAKPLISWTRRAIRGLQKLLSELEALVADPGDEYSLVETLTAHVKWYFSKSSVGGLRASLSVARESINGFTNIRCIEKLEEQLRFLEQAVRDGERQTLEAKLGMAVEKHMKVLEQKIQNRCDMRHEIDERLQRAKNKVIVHQEKHQSHEFTPDPDKLFHFTESVEQYVEDVLPPMGPSNGVHNHYQVHELAHERPRAGSKQPTPLAPKPKPKPKAIDPRPFPQPTKTPTTQNRSPNNPDTVPNPPSTPPTPFASSACTSTSTSTSISTPTSTSISTSTSNKRTTPSSSTNIPYRAAAEYINDPFGTILSPPIPKPKHRYAPKPPAKMPNWLPPTYPGPRNPEQQNPSRNPTRVEPTSPPTEPPSPATSVITTSITHNMMPPPLFDQPAESQRIPVYGESLISALPPNSASEREQSDDGYEDENEGGNTDQGPSPFHPIAGVQGKYPPGWRQRHERGASPTDFW
ncbi:hypothetical protein K458DRAFT_487167 [Lentithecium fluviatile CBS 122367]|uniref:Fungal N-terminal domain-containing protein n=1 Tax=Lentithecium fluviatile CBS 122367 TaxID=1168545 RepID=A0A6G1J3Y6_9PLEO|nr:hypothetical protein K458DRAFT_487167 [Lentithecium fluviatile CBS 122367]